MWEARKPDPPVTFMSRKSIHQEGSESQDILVRTKMSSDIVLALEDAEGTELEA
jgi:hypothetical protein